MRAADLLNRKFAAPRPNHTRVTDLPNVPAWSGFVDVASVRFTETVARVGIADVEDVTFDWVPLHNNERLYSFLGDLPPEEHEANYSAGEIGRRQRNGGMKPQTV